TADNYRDGAYAKEPDADGARVLAQADYSQWAHYQVTTTDQAGRKTVTSADPWGHTSSTTRPDGTTQKTAADIVDEAVAQGVLGKDQNSVGLDQARAVSVQDADSAQRANSARVVFADGTLAAGSSSRADALGRPLTSTSGEVTTTPSYGAGGVPQSAVLNPAAPDLYPGQEFTAALTHDLAGRQTSKALAQGAPSQGDTFTGTVDAYDAGGRLASQTDQLGNTTAYTYGDDGRIARTEVQTGDGKRVTTTAYTYDQDTSLLTSTSVTDAEGATTVRHMEYDSLNRVAGIWQSDGSSGDADARKDSLIVYGYDGEGRLVSVAYPDGKAVSRTYDAAGQLTTASDAAGALTTYTYNPDGSLAEAVQKTADGQTASAVYTYDSLGRISRTAYGNGTTFTVDYFDSGQPKRETLTRADGTLLSETSYTYNTRGDLATRTDTRPSAAGEQRAGSGQGTGAGEDGSAGAPPAATHTVHGYDAYGRLTATTVHSGTDAGAPVLRSTAYTANAAGDITTATSTDASGKKTGTVYETDSAGRLTALTAGGRKTSQDWDAAGNLLQSADGTAWTYSPDNKPTTATAADGTRTAYAYWADGSRRSATTTAPDGTASTVLFHYTPDGAIANDTHTGSGGQPRTGAYLTGAAGREARTLTGTPGAALYLHTDRRGNTVLETSPAGGVHASRAYSDYGLETGPGGAPLADAARAADPAANPFRFGGEYTNTETRTHYTPARLYHPETGRFTTRDPHPTPLNKYQAFNTNPVEYTDPTGNISFKLPRYNTRLQRQKQQQARINVARTDMWERWHAEVEKRRLDMAAEHAEKQQGIIDLLDSGITPMKGTHEEYWGKSIGFTLFRRIGFNAFPEGCQTVLWAAIKTFTGSPSLPAGRVTFTQPDAETIWGSGVASSSFTAQAGQKGSAMEPDNGDRIIEAVANAPLRKIFALAAFNSQGQEAHIEMAWRGSKASKATDMNQDSLEGSRSMVSGITEWFGRMKSDGMYDTFILYDTGATKLPKGKLRESLQKNS
uniref:RHS repeat-associated core domain-containing protein n=1 Tax=Streptomyces sp. NRRL F-2664 TaxID=1463842 RepID=UPI0004C7EEED